MVGRYTEASALALSCESDSSFPLPALGSLHFPDAVLLITLRVSGILTHDGVYFSKMTVQPFLQASCPTGVTDVVTNRRH